MYWMIRVHVLMALLSQVISCYVSGLDGRARCPSTVLPLFCCQFPTLDQGSSFLSGGTETAAQVSVAQSVSWYHQSFCKQFSEYYVEKFAGQHYSLFYKTLCSRTESYLSFLQTLKTKEIKVHRKSNIRTITMHASYKNRSVSCQGTTYDLNRVGKRAKVP